MTNRYPEAFFFNSLEDAHKKNVLIAISCNKKASDIITRECAKKIIEQAARFTTGHLGIFIADEIMKYNEIAANRSEPKAMEIAMEYGGYFFSLFSEVVEKMPPEIKERISILRYKDIANDKHQNGEFGVEKIQNIYSQTPDLKTKTDQAAVQLLKWRCADYAPNKKRVGAILDFIFREVPIVGAWDEININGMTYHGLIYPAINPRGMKIIAGVVSEFDKIIGSTQRLLLVMHISEEGTLQSNEAVTVDNTV